VISEARRKALDLAAGFTHCALDRPRGELAAVHAGQKGVVTAVGADMGGALSDQRTRDRYRRLLLEGFSSWLSDQPHLLTVVIAGLNDKALLTSVDCEAENNAADLGTLLRVPPTSYRNVAIRLASVFRDSQANRLSVRNAVDGRLTSRELRQSSFEFLIHRSSDAFLRVYLDVDSGLFSRLLDFGNSIDATAAPRVLARFHQAHLLPEQVRLLAVERMLHLAVESPDSSWIHAPAWQILLTPTDRTRLMDAVRDKLLPLLGTDDDPLPDERVEYDDPFEQTLYDYQQAFEEAGDVVTALAFQQALDYFMELPLAASESESREPEPDEDWHREEYWHREEEGWYARRMGRDRSPRPIPTLLKPDRSIFDDIDDDS
jgi:hypothetical protein